MPIYEYQCDCGNKEERLLPMQEYNQSQTCVCGKVMLLKISVPAIAILKQYGRQMALDSLNSRTGGFPSRKDDLRAKGTRLAVAGLEKPPRKYY